MLNSSLYSISLIIVLIGGLNWFFIGSTGFNFIKFLIEKITGNTNRNLNKIVYLIIGICTLYLLIFQQRHMFLSFLDETVMPPTIFQSQTNISSNAKMSINAPNGLKVIYWGANAVKPNFDNIKNWQEAYDGYKNSGVVDVVNDKAEINFSIPVRYRVGLFNMLLDRHIHYRILYPNGVISRVHTKKIKNYILQ